jgi:hypothetical protein
MVAPASIPKLLLILETEILIYQLNKESSKIVALRRILLDSVNFLKILVAQNSKFCATVPLMFFFCFSIWNNKLTFTITFCS